MKFVVSQKTNSIYNVLIEAENETDAIEKFRKGNYSTTESFDQTQTHVEAKVISSLITPNADKENIQ